MRRTALALFLFLLACGSSERFSRLERDFDVEIVQAARIGDIGIDLRGLGTERGDLVNLDDVTSGLEAGGELGRPEVTTWKRSNLVPHTGKLEVGDEEELPLRAMEVTARVTGFRARVVLDCLYENDRDRQLEGTFKLRLPDGASPFYLAFGETATQAKLPKAAPSRDLSPAGILASRQESWRSVKEARMVRREKAAHAYGETARRQVDPALMEWSGAGVFSSRVFPLLPKKTHRIVIGYDVDLLRVGDDLELRLDLPTGVPERTVRLSVAGRPDFTVTPEVPVFFDGDDALATFDDPGVPAIVVRLKRPGTVLLTGDDEETGPYFATTLRPELPDDPVPGSPRAVFLVDTSLSSNPEKFGVWLELLGAILSANRDHLSEFAVLFFNIETFWWREAFVPNSPANVEALLEFAGTLALEGATDLGAALRAAGEPAWARGAAADLFLLSDGAATWGGEPPRSLPGPVFAYRTGFSGTDVRNLASLARESGGAVFSVVGAAEVAAAAVAHARRPWRIRSIAAAGGRDLILAGRPADVYPGQTLWLAGRGRLAPGAEVVLTLARGAEERVARFRPDQVLSSDLAPRIFGQIAVGQLEDLGDLAEDEAKAYASHFRVVGATCALLMLETEEDYASFDIEPEDDARVVSARGASSVVEDALARRGGERSDPKAAFLAWLGRMERMPGVTLEIPDEVWRVAQGLPAAAFAVEPVPLACKARTWESVPGGIQEQLASRKLDYDALSAEAERRRKALGPADALRALSSLVETSPGDTALARDVAFSAMEWGLPNPALDLFDRVARLRPFEPETYRAMARCLSLAGKADLALLYYEVALAGKWNPRYGSFREIATLDYARLLRRIGEGELRSEAVEFARSRLDGLRQGDLSRVPRLVVVITWNTDRTDVDLHVTDPRGEKCWYKNKKTRIGGTLTADVTDGFGPEMFKLPDPVRGTYWIGIRYYSSDRSRASLRTKVYATIYENWGTAAERVTRKAVVLGDEKDFRSLAGIRMR